MKRPISDLTLVLMLPLIFWAVVWLIDPNRTLRDIPMSAPKWVEESRYGTCSAAITGTPVANLLAPISIDQAARIGTKVIETQTNLHTISGQTIVPFAPVLVEREFPDNQKRLAWAYGEARVTDKYGMTASAEVVYIDATTGEVLLLIKDIFAGDPSFTCSQINNFMWPQMMMQLQRTALYIIAVILTLFYVLVVGVIGLRRFRRKPPTQPAEIPTSIQ